MPSNAELRRRAKASMGMGEIGCGDPAAEPDAQAHEAALQSALAASDARVRRLQAELQHRVSNLLAIVRSISRRSVERASSLEELQLHQSGRIDALARVEDMLVRTEGRGADLEDLLWNELMVVVSPHEERRLSIDGPAVLLASKTAERLALAFHELTTNALKFGALALGNPEGRIEVRWTCTAQPDPRLQIVWAESGVPVMNTAPKWTGFGRDFLEHGLTYDLEAETRLRFLPGGVRCEMSLPLNARTVAAVSERPAPEQGP